MVEAKAVVCVDDILFLFSDQDACQDKVGSGYQLFN